MDAEVAGDGADAPVLGVEEAANLGAVLGRDHRGASSSAEPAAHVRQGLVADEAPAPTTAGAADGRGQRNTRISLGMASLLLVVARNAERARRRRGNDAAVGGALGSRMRHCLRAEGPTGPILRLPGGMTKPAWTAMLITAAGVAQRRVASSLGARPGTVAIASITVPTEEEHLTAIAASTDHKPEGIQASPCATHGAGQPRDGVR
jgi:hypothetical protein